MSHKDLDNSASAQFMEPELIFTRDLDASRSNVFGAWTNAERLRSWFRPTDFTVKLCEVDARAGGHFRVHMEGPDGTVYPTRGDFIKVDAPERLVYLDSWDDDREDNEQVLTIVEFSERSEGTTLKLFSAFCSKEQRDKVLSSGVVEGWKMLMDNLATELGK